MMKKIWFVLMILCTVGALAACSDDDDDSGKGGKSPVSGVYLPVEGQIGQVMEVVGDGFAATAEFWLKDAAGKSTEITGVEFQEGKVLLTVPAGLEAGKYSLILKQDGEWNLGMIPLVKAKLKVTRLASFSMFIDYGEEMIDEMIYKLTYDEQNRLKAFSTETIDEEENPVTISCNFEYAGNTVKVSGNMFDDKFMKAFNLELGEDGKVKSSTIGDITAVWEYTTDGYLKTLTIDGVAHAYDFRNGNLITAEAPNFGNMGAMQCMLAYGTEKNSSIIDITSFIMAAYSYSNSLQDPQFCAYLLGIAGKTSVNLPVSLDLFDMTCDITYTKEGDNIKTVTIPYEGQGTTYTFNYETAEIEQ